MVGVVAVVSSAAPRGLDNGRQRVATLGPGIFGWFQSKEAWRFPE